MRVASPPVAVVILVWNNVTDTLACLESVCAMDYPNCRVIVVDNGSEAGVVEAIRAAFPTVTILALQNNVGFSAGNNAGLRYAMDGGCDYVLLLNNDTVVARDSLEILVRFAAANPAAGIVGPSVWEPDGSRELYFGGGYVDWTAGRTWIAARTATSSHVPEQADFVCGCAVLASRRFISEAGPLDPEYFFNFEDTEWAVRGRRLGFEAWCVPEARVWHKASSSLGAASAANTYYMTRNALRFFRRNAPPIVRWLAVLRVLARTARTVLAWRTKPAYRDERFRRRAVANLFAMRDFFRSRFGPMDGDVARACGIFTQL